ncbi:uncharacterized protein pdzph1 [Scomber scombrus]|uniref:Uncharacterized protein pdzph1 n=1 Tax=Scomber scombrus TaxID=13677 RepID=A0AAV1PVH3_SCOSC
MSKRGKRRNSKRRKSSSSSKQSVSPYIFQKQRKSNCEGYKDDVVEKGETDSLRKENVLSGSEDEDKYNNAPFKEKRFKQDNHVNSFPNQRSIHTTTTEDKEKQMKIVTTVSVIEKEDSSPNIMFQQSHEPLSDNLTHSSTPINYIGSHMKVEIGIKTTVVFMNESGDGAERFLKSNCESMGFPNNELSEQPSQTVTNHNRTQNTTNYRFTFGGMSDSKSVSPTKISVNPNYCKCCSDHKQQISTDFTFTDHPSSPPPLLNIKPQGEWKHFCRSFGSNQFWDIPPPREFADIKYNTLEDLTHDLASCRIGACSPADKPQREFHPTPNISCNEESGCPFYVEEKEKADLQLLFVQSSESDNYEPMLMTTNRSSFAKDFIKCKKRKSWIRNNSIATVEHRACSIPKKRRQTFPVLSEGAGLFQDDFLASRYNEFLASDTISSLIMCSLPLQTQRLGKFYQCNDRFFSFGKEKYNSSQTKGSSKPVSEIPNSHDGKQSLLRPFYMTSSDENPNDVFVNKHCQRQSGIRYCCKDLRQQDIDSEQSVFKYMENSDIDDCGNKLDQSEVEDCGIDQEMGEVDYHGPEPFTDEISRRALCILVIPPSCSGSEEQIPQSHPVKLSQNNTVENASQEDSVSISPKHRKSSAVTIGAVEQRFLQMDSRLTLGDDIKKHHQAALEASCISPLQGIDVHSLNTDEVTEIQLKSFGEKTSNTHKETNDLQLDTGRRGKEDSDKPVVTASCPASGSTDTDGAEEQLSKSDKADKQTAFRSSSEAKEHLKPMVHIDPDSSGSDHWAKRRKLFKESKQWSSAGGSSITSDITEESVLEDTHSVDMTIRDNEDRGFYTETFHSAAWIYHGDDGDSGAIPPSLINRTRAISIRERTVKISKAIGEYPWGFRIQFSKPIVVTEVDTNGAAEEAGLMVGDYVLAVNGTDVTSIPHSEAADLARQGPDVLTLTIGSDIARGPNTPRPACRGYLHKRTQSSLIKGWRKRWFVLTHDCCLYYYRHKRDEGKRQALSAVKLEGAEVGPDISLGKPFVLKCYPQSGNRVYFFCATSNQEMKRWLEAMEKAVHPITQNHVWVDVTRHNSNLPPLAVKNPDCLGLLHKMDKNKDMWVQHYCILKDGCLYLYSGIRATHAHGGIYLQGYMVREQPFGSKKSTIELKPPSDEFKTFYFCAENPNENKRWIIAIKASMKKWLPLHHTIQDYINRPPEETRM